MSSAQLYQQQSPIDTPNLPFATCIPPNVEFLSGPRTTYTDMCVDQLSQPLHADPESFDSPAASISGSSAQPSVCSDDDLSQREIDSPILAYHPPYYSPSSLEYRSLLDSAAPIYSLEPSISYGRDRIVFVERLIWTCVGTIYSIYGEPGSREAGPTASLPLEELVHNGLIHGLSNEIVIQPLMDAIQRLPDGNLQHHQADMIPFPLFMAEMLRRMRASCFLLRTAMRYILDIENMVKAAIERAQCGWCRSGIEGCDHAGPSSKGLISRFSRGRKPFGPQLSGAAPVGISASRFTKTDRLSPLADPRKAFLGALILANKFHRDRSVGNKSWAALIGLPLEDVHSAERAVGEALGWTLSRPWISDAKDNNGDWLPGSNHPTFAEPLFATNDQEVLKYGVKELRDKGELPPPLSQAEILKEMASISKTTTATTTAAFWQQQLPAINQDRQMAVPKPNPIRRHTSDSLTPTSDRKIAPLPSRQLLLPSQTLKPMANPIRKAVSAPFVLEPHTSGYCSPDLASTSATPTPTRQDMVQSIMDSEWGHPPSDGSECSTDSFMDETPTLEQLRSKRKASEDFGPKPLLRRCGTEGQPIVVPASDFETARSSTLRRHATLPLELEDQRASRLASDAIVVDGESDNDMCPDLDHTDTPTTLSPSVGMVTRSSTPANPNGAVSGHPLLGSPKVVRAGSDWWRSSVNDTSPIMRHKVNQLYMPTPTQPKPPLGLQFQFGTMASHA